MTSASISVLMATWAVDALLARLASSNSAASPPSTPLTTAAWIPAVICAGGTWALLIIMAIAVAAISGEIGVEPLPTAAVSSATALAGDSAESRW